MSAPPASGPRDPWASEVGETDRFGVFAFFAVMILFGAVAYGIYSKGSWSALSSVSLIPHDRTAARLNAALPGQSGQPPAPLTLKPGIAPNPAAPVVAQGQPPAAAPVVQPTPAPATAVYIPPVAAAMGIPGAQVQPTATAQSQAPPTTASAAAPSAPPVGSKYRVVNTSGDGVYIRRTPKLADKIVPWSENAVMEYQGEQVDSDGMHWAKMKDPRGNVGWVPTQYLAP